MSMAGIKLKTVSLYNRILIGRGFGEWQNQFSNENIWFILWLVIKLMSSRTRNGIRNEPSWRLDTIQILPQQALQDELEALSKEMESMDMASWYN